MLSTFVDCMSSDFNDYSKSKATESISYFDLNFMATRIRDQKRDKTSYILLLSWRSASSFTASDLLDIFNASDAAIPPMPPTIWLYRSLNPDFSRSDLNAK